MARLLINRLIPRAMARQHTMESILPARVTTRTWMNRALEYECGSIARWSECNTTVIHEGRKLYASRI